MAASSSERFTLCDPSHPPASASSKRNPLDWQVCRPMTGRRPRTPHLHRGPALLLKQGILGCSFRFLSDCVVDSVLPAIPSPVQSTTSSTGRCQAANGWLSPGREKAADACALQYVPFASSVDQLVEQNLAVGRKIGRSLWQSQFHVECIHGKNILVRRGSQTCWRAWTVVLLAEAEVVVHLLAKRAPGHAGVALRKSGCLRGNVVHPPVRETICMIEQDYDKTPRAAHRTRPRQLRRFVSADPAIIIDIGRATALVESHAYRQFSAVSKGGAGQHKRFYLLVLIHLIFLPAQLQRNCQQNKQYHGDQLHR